jgi:hypothetical protein
MPTLPTPQLVQTESAWGAPSNQFYDELCLSKVAILSALEFYEERGLPIPDANSEMTPEEDEVLLPIAGALAHAAEAAKEMPNGVLLASLRKISRKPELFFSDELPGELQWAIACSYQRDDERPGRYWRDVWGDQPDAEKPTEPNIKKAALLAADRIHPKMGRPPNRADEILAERLGEIYRRSGQRIVRGRFPEMRHGRVAWVEGGPFYDFLNLVLKSLQRYISDNRLTPVTVNTIVRCVSRGLIPDAQFLPLYSSRANQEDLGTFPKARTSVRARKGTMS